MNLDKLIAWAAENGEPAHQSRIDPDSELGKAIARGEPLPPWVRRTADGHYEIVSVEDGGRARR